MAVEEMLAPVPAAADYSVSAELWQRLEDEIAFVSGRISAGDELVPDDVANVQKLKKQVDGYVTDFNRAMRNAQGKYKSMVDRRLTELGFDKIEQFVATKRQEQTAMQNARISAKMETLKMITDGLLKRTVRLKDTVLADQLLPMFTARFPKVQSGARNNDITDWQPYFAIIAHTIAVLDTFFRDPKYEGAELLPLYTGSMRELLAFVKDGRQSHLDTVKIKFEEDRHFIHEAALKKDLVSVDDAMDRIHKVLEDLRDFRSHMVGCSSITSQTRTRQAWEEISLIVRLVNNQ